MTPPPRVLLATRRRLGALRRAARRRGATRWGGVLGLASVAARLAEAFPLLAGFWVSAWGLGRLVHRGGRGQALALGAAALLLAGWLVAWGVGVHRWTAAAIAFPGWVSAGFGWWQGRRSLRPAPPRMERRSGGFGPLLLARSPRARAARGRRVHPPPGASGGSRLSATTPPPTTCRSRGSGWRRGG